MFAVVGVLLSSCSDRQSTANEELLVEEMNYELLPIEKRDISIDANYPATIKGCQEVELYPQVSGLLTQINVKEGERVKKGEILFVIDQTKYQANYESAKAARREAEAAEKTAQLQLDSKRTLYEKEIVSEFDFLTAENALLMATARKETAIANERDAANNLSFTEIAAPFDGVIGVLPYRLGALMGANNSEPITTISDNSVMDIHFSLSSNQVIALTREYGTTVTAFDKLPPLSLLLSDNSLHNEKGKIVSISGVADQATGSVVIRAEFPNSSRVLKGGYKGNLIMPTVYQNVIVIPKAATVEVQDKIFVYKIENGKTKMATIIIAKESTDSEYIVLSGLNDNDTIVSSGARLVREGVNVKIE